MGNKAILMSIKPRYVCEILNGNKTIEVRKKFPKDYVGWVYIYCTKGKENLYKDYYVMSGKEGYFLTKCGDVEKLNGKVVGRFWCDKVNRYDIQSPLMEQHSIYKNGQYHFELETCHNDLVDYALINPNDLFKYLKETSDTEEATLYGLQISRLEVFEEPKELKDFYCFGYKENLKKKQLEIERAKDIKDFYQRQMQFFNENWQVKNAPQSFQFIEGEND